MCTVTYIPQPQGFVLTSNRDEKAFRETIIPHKYRRDDVILCYPKDAVAGGSWIAMSNKGRVVCLLNGAFVPHTKQAFHTHSRGKVLIDAAGSGLNPDQFLTAEALAHTEPFTLLTIDFDGNEMTSFSELIWDGNDKHNRQLDTRHSYIWSSVTLYSAANRKERKVWFNQFLKESKMHPTASGLLQFHSGKHTNDSTVNVIMMREGELKTVSTTQIIHEGSKLEMSYYDLIKNTNHTIQL
ncbi:NRDE family protein [Geofilum sp. OHC36d9]|uniref:NRDE family protein n=1 Tax=Geofilum sp. OHC36d9 TaxID=3458413 RepID=UPI004033DA7D